jgi:hemerythrin-like domain-containing protein
MAKAEIFERLKQDHDHHRTMLAELEAAKGDDRAKLFEAFRVEVTAHAAAEEESLYATMLACPDLREDAQHSVSEHKEIDDFLEELQALDFESELWGKTFAKMRHRYEHHIDEEEEEMFPDAAATLSEEAEARIAETFRRRKPAELERAK